MAPPTYLELKERLSKQDLRVHELEQANWRLQEGAREQQRLNSILLGNLMDSEEWARIAVEWSALPTNSKAVVDRMAAVIALAQDAGVKPPYKIDSADNDSLIYLARFWTLDGDWMTCKGCKRSLIASRDGEELWHADGCKYSDQQHPWRKLRNIIAPFAAKVGEG